MTDHASNGLSRFVQAQEPVFATACAELRRARKESHWMWFVFPQLRGLGRSDTARFYGIVDREEAIAYWHHAVLRERLLHCTQLVLSIQHRTAHEVFGSPDDAKLRSCMTLFASVAPEESAFNDVLVKFFGGSEDPTTVSMLRVAGPSSQIPLP
ncbi:DUF1810 domain-containing protein [soil metagenome]